jgi:hypothetical protein
MPALLPLQSSEKVVEGPLWTPKLLSGATQSERRDERRKISYEEDVAFVDRPVLAVS